ncbi:hypothetical protein I6J18_01995 [Peribacillus psychrosaccharolyticus]|uniref:Uncharacterized protein n=1 Tax=Peribacillus psychrosaccharolyticus TaxID=1407 RepID=A0A974S1X2_PERPY|nr:hypothetical protein [Peribacillus psychrosaccharolyticus]MEC2056075.1 hypothetical protein [Peribacillus psychrosaccharolyticus]MED3745516.1 hypothetical protein [Peribacillus psychrosaccharolyticus]QQT00730.1 hypothetical protein I6J18_01995 [Peribacillus psychrosaccharolyticus]
MENVIVTLAIISVISIIILVIIGMVGSVCQKNWGRKTFAWSLLPLAIFLVILGMDSYGLLEEETSKTEIVQETE